MKAAALILAALALAACSGGGGGPEESRIEFERNSQFSTEYLRVFLNLEDGTPLTVNTLDDAVDSAPFDSPFPGHRGKEWRFLKEERHGTSPRGPSATGFSTAARRRSATPAAYWTISGAAGAARFPASPTRTATRGP